MWVFDVFYCKMGPRRPCDVNIESNVKVAWGNYVIILRVSSDVKSHVKELKVSKRA